MSRAALAAKAAVVAFATITAMAPAAMASSTAGPFEPCSGPVTEYTCTSDANMDPAFARHSVRGHASRYALRHGFSPRNCKETNLDEYMSGIFYYASVTWKCRR
ncbi:hypothetical protein [Crossiella cryophila]|uniref:Secreted protein n=1 Tax=Crossiella cryophila TaxID=43355 RepID=A0A7W7CH78_9PSEU|nr:hypothetical protein [Crossiella cryophila]MBB4679726.1 hypothetical protein [Crossiella cryophila]